MNSEVPNSRAGLVSGPGNDKSLDAHCIEVKNGNLSGLVARESAFLIPLFAQGILTLKDKQGSQQIKRDRYRQSFLMACAGKTYFLKVHYGKGLSAFTRRPSNRRRLANIQRLTFELQHYQVNLPKILATLFFRPSLLQWESASVYEFLQHSTTLTRFLQGDIALSKKQAMIDKVVDQLLILHKKALVHGDMKSNNIMVSNDQVYLIDVDGLGSITLNKTPEKDMARFLVGLLDTGMPVSEVGRILHRYATARNLVLDKLFKKVKKNADKMILRHRRKYNSQLNCLPDL